MKKTKKRLWGVFSLILLVLSGCGRDCEITFFDGTKAGAAYGQLSESGEAAQAETAEVLQQESLAPEQICVHVCGQIYRPGVVTLPVGSRAWEAVEAAGGLTEKAQEEAVNLAAVLQDGEKLYIPALGEIVPETDEGTAGNGLINLNTADAERLQSLPGIGESRAADIISYRERNGGFRSVEEIMQVPGIKESTYEKIRDKIAVD